MAKNRAKAQAVILQIINKLDPSGDNGKLKEQEFAAMSDEQFDLWIEAIRSGKDTIAMVCPNLKSNRAMSTRNNLKVGAELGIEFFQRVWMVNPVTGDEYLTPKKYLICHPPVRRQIQTRENKMAVPKDNSKIDELTGQVTGDSGKSSISSPEMLVLVAAGLVRTTEEFMKMRGGDEVALRYSDQQIINTGGVSLDQVGRIPSKARATTTLSTFLRGMHFDTNYDQP